MMRSRTSIGVRDQARWAARAASIAAATSSRVDNGRDASGAPVIGVWLTWCSARGAATTRRASRRTSAGSTAYVAVGSVSGSAMRSGAIGAA